MTETIKYNYRLYLNFQIALRTIILFNRQKIKVEYIINIFLTNTNINMNKHLFIFLFTFISITQIEAAPQHSAKQNIEIILEKTLFDDPQVQDLFELITAKAIKDSKKEIDFKTATDAMRQALKNGTALEPLIAIYAKEFNEEELENIRALVTNPMYDAFNEKLPELSKEAMKSLERYIQGEIKNTNAPAKTAGKNALTLLTDDTFSSAVEDSPQLVLIDFYADWCVPCQALEIILESLQEELGAAVKFTKVNIDESKEIAEKFQAKQLPLVLLVKDGKVVESHSGFATREALKNKITNTLK